MPAKCSHMILNSGHGESLVPPLARGSVSLSLSLSHIMLNPRVLSQVPTCDLASIIRQSLDEGVAHHARGPGIITQREAQQVTRYDAGAKETAASTAAGVDWEAGASEEVEVIEEDAATTVVGAVKAKAAAPERRLPSCLGMATTRRRDGGGTLCCRGVLSGRLGTSGDEDGSRQCWVFWHFGWGVRGVRVLGCGFVIGLGCAGAGG